MATVNLGKIRLNWRGTYSASTTYEFNDAVFHNSSSWVYIYASNSAGNTPQNNSAYWQILAEGASTLSHGSIVYGGASGNEELSAGTSGQFLKTRGAGQSPVWATGTLPNHINHNEILPFTHSSSLTPQTKGSALALCSFDGTNSYFTCNSHGLENGQRMRFVGNSSSLVTANSNFALDYTYYVVNKTTDTFQLSKTYTFGSSPAGGSAVTGSTSVSSVTNLYRQKLISDNWLGWDEVNQESLIECGVQWPHKIGPCFQNIMPQTVDLKHHITTNYELKGQGNTGYNGSGLWTSSNTDAYGTYDVPIATQFGTFEDDEKWVAVGHAGHANLWARTNKGNLYMCGANQAGVLGLGTGASLKHLRKIEYFSDNNLFVLACCGTPLSRDTTYDGDPTMYAIVTDKGSGMHNGMQRHERRLLYAWGDGNYGQIGNGQDSDTNTPTLVSVLPETVMQIMCLQTYGHGSVLAICEDTESAQEDGNMQLWFSGSAPTGNGFGNTSEINTFTKYTGSPINEADDENAYKDVGYIFMMGHYYGTSFYNSRMYFITTKGRLYGCGYSHHGELGMGTTSATTYTTFQRMYPDNDNTSTVTFREVTSDGWSTKALTGLPGTGHFGQTYGAWGEIADLWQCGYNGSYVMNPINTTNVGQLTKYTNSTSWEEVSNSGNQHFPVDKITHVFAPFEYDRSLTVIIDYNGNIWCWGLDPNYVFTDQAQGTTARYPVMMRKSWGNILDYSTNDHKLGYYNRYPIVLGGHVYSTGTEIFYVHTNDGKWYSGGANDGNLGFPAGRVNLYSSLSERNSQF